MIKKESYIIGFGLGVLIPILIFVFFWWIVSVLTIFKIAFFSEFSIAIIALSGLLFGVIVDILFLKRLTTHFYKLKTSLVIVVYLFCSIIVVAFFMGFPIGNLILGTIAGLYIGRKYHYINQNQYKLSKIVKSTSIFTALVTSLEALLIGLLVLKEDYLLGSINQFLGLQIFSKNTWFDITVIILLCCILSVVQFLLTQKATKIAIRI